MHVQIDRVFTTVARNLGLKDFSRYTNNFIEWAYEAEKLIGSRDTFIQKEATYDASGAKATGTITFAANPVSGDSITLNGVKLYFRNSTDLGKAKSPNEVEIGINLSETLDNSVAQYGLIQSLKGFANTTDEIGKYIDSAIYNYPEALNIADYSVQPNLIENSSFSSTSNWTVTTTNDVTAAISGGVFTVEQDGASAGYGRIVQPETLTSGNTYELSFTVISITATTHFTVHNYSDSLNQVSEPGFEMTQEDGSVQITNTGTVSSTFVSDGTGGIDVRINALSDNDKMVIDNIKLKDITTTASNVLTITAKEIGPKGNEYSLSSDNANAKVSGLNLVGGKGIYRNQQITLPENNIKVLGIRVGEDDSDHKHSVLQKTSAVHRQRVGKTSNSSEQKAFRYYIEGNRLNIQHDNLDEITVVYIAYPTDIRGWPKIKEGHETAVAQYIMWQMKLIEFYNGKLPQYITKELEKRWYILCGKARGDDGMPTSQELKQIGNMWNTLVPVTNDRSTLTDF